MPYGTLRYRVYFQKIVVSTDWSILNSRPYEKLAFARLAGESTKSRL